MFYSASMVHTKTASTSHAPVDPADKTLPSLPRRSSSVASFDLEADVVIVGFGGAGASAAIEARKAGADVLVLERASEGGGSTSQSGGILYFGGGTPIQKACGFEDTTEEMFKYVLAASGPNPDEAKVRLFCDESLAHYAWFLEQGVTFKPTFYAKKTTEPPTDDGLLYSGNEDAWPFNLLAKPAPRGHKPQTTGSAGHLIMKRLIEKATSAGARVVENARVVTLVVDDDRRVVGLVVRVLGEEKIVRARRGVILCAGGFIMNGDMVAAHVPKLLNVNIQIGNPGDDGAGILMGMGAGGSAICMGEGFVSMPFYPPSKLVNGIIVNAQGQRFVNEDAYHGRTGDFILRQSGGTAYLIVDNASFGRPIAGMQIRAAEETIPELERALELPEGTLVATVDYYNARAREGKDPLFHKKKDYLVPLAEPPFAALDLSLTKAVVPGFTMGGLDTLPTGEVLTADRTIVKGLYAAGRNTAGIPRSAGGYSSGLSIGCATFFGRLAGKTAATASPA